jgi:hypothetical protein
MRVPSLDFLALLRILVAHGVDFIIVGGVSAVLQGAPISTFDLDLVLSRAPDNQSPGVGRAAQRDFHRHFPTAKETKGCYRV